jgi:hypothetical protein
MFIMWWSTTLVIAAVAAGMVAPGLALSQVRSPLGSTTPSGAVFDRLRDSTSRPVPQVGPPLVRPPESTWVPDRFVQVPGNDSPVFVPGHWERRLGDHEVYTPPLTGRTREGGTVDFPAGTRPPVNERQLP